MGFHVKCITHFRLFTFFPSLSLSLVLYTLIDLYYLCFHKFKTKSEENGKHNLSQCADASRNDDDDNNKNNNDCEQLTSARTNNGHDADPSSSVQWVINILLAQARAFIQYFNLTLVSIYKTKINF